VSTKTNSGSRPRLAVVGCGWWATQFHIPGLLSYDGAELVALAEPDEGRLSAACRTFELPGYLSLDELLAEVSVDGVVVATTSATHYEVAQRALQAGLHVMVEKPMTIRAREAWELVELAHTAGLHLQLGYTHHFTRSAQRLMEVVAGGAIGELIQVSGLYASMVEAYYRGRPEEYDKVFHFALTGPAVGTYSDPKVAGGGQGMTQVTHLIGMILWATGRRVSGVCAFMDNCGLAVDLVDAIAFRFDNGGVGNVGSTGNLRPGEPKQEEVRYYGTDGFALQDLVSASVEIHYASGRVENLGAEDPYPAEAPARGFADLIAGRAPNLAPGEAGARAVEFLEAAYLSAARGEKVDVAEVTTVSTTSQGGI
jgi:predicted dehydrogenase